MNFFARLFVGLRVIGELASVDLERKRKKVFHFILNSVFRWPGLIRRDE